MVLVDAQVPHRCNGALSPDCACPASFRNRRRINRTRAAPAPPAVPETPKQPDAVVHYDITDDDFKALMSRRKARFGLKDSVDMIVESGETVEVGGISVPMEEILDKIRLKTGAMVETDLGPTLSTVSEGERVDRLFTQLKEKEKRFRELAVDLADAPADAPDTDEKLREFESLREVVADYQEYRRALSAIRDWELVLESPDLREKLTSEADLLTRQKQQMEQDLAVRLGTVADPAAMETHLLKILAESRVRLKEIDDALRTSAAHTRNHRRPHSGTVRHCRTHHRPRKIRGDTGPAPKNHDAADPSGNRSDGGDQSGDQKDSACGRMNWKTP